MEALYKYMTSGRVLTCLPEVGDGTLRATQPAALNDPFECAVRALFIEFGWDELRRDQEFAVALSSIPDTTPVTADDVVRAKEAHGSLYLRDLLTKQLSQRFGIISFSTEARHPLMWSHYTQGGSGFAVGYDVNLLWALGDRDESLRPVPVRYMKEIAPIESYENLDFQRGDLIDLLSRKSDHWSYESERRLVVKLDQTIGAGHRDSRGLLINLVRVPNEAVVAVFHTERTPEDIVQEVGRRLADPNNRYGTRRLTKLVASAEHYGYEDASE